MIDRWRRKKERKDTDQLDTLLDSLREVQHAHLRRDLVPVKKQIKEQREGKRQLDNQSEIATERGNNKKRTLALDSLTALGTSYASFNSFTRPIPGTNKKCNHEVKQHDDRQGKGLLLKNLTYINLNFKLTWYLILQLFTGHEQQGKNRSKSRFLKWIRATTRSNKNKPDEQGKKGIFHVMSCTKSIH